MFSEKQKIVFSGLGFDEIQQKLWRPFRTVDWYIYAYHSFVEVADLSPFGNSYMYSVGPPLVPIVFDIDVGSSGKHVHEKCTSLHHFYIVNLGVYWGIHIFHPKQIFGNSLEPPRKCGSNGYPQTMF